MYQYLVGLSILKSIAPYFRKHVLDHLESHDFFLLNSLFIFGFLALFVTYRYFFDKTLSSSIKKIKTLKISHIGCIFTIALFTFIGSITIMEFDKNHNTPMINALLIKIFSTISLVLTSIFIFKEKYTFLQIVGICLTIAGVFLISNKTI